MRFFGIGLFTFGFFFLLAGSGWAFAVFENDIDPPKHLEQLIGPMVMGAMGLIFSSVGGGVLLNLRKQRIKRETLMHFGRKIKAEVTQIEMNTHISVNGRHPSVITCVSTLSGSEKTFKSHNIYGSLLLSIGDEVTVYVDFRNTGNYWVDVPEDAVRT
jgi:hypothetical protein